ncbi:hypothetical protein VP01_1850g2 [Puccinia sorghi]|uniref:Uncharacterized protein n=1 Tax=Puccinia sorghi TaxID=27349 RepID=A0A0L6VDQ3_9BASI|nr:hypothetical protein VP01_1850g2 [Puccinia sorghi]
MGTFLLGDPAYQSPIHLSLGWTLYAFVSFVRTYATPSERDLAREAVLIPIPNPHLSISPTHGPPLTPTVTAATKLIRSFHNSLHNPNLELLFQIQLTSNIGLAVLMLFRSFFFSFSFADKILSVGADAQLPVVDKKRTYQDRKKLNRGDKGVVEAVAGVPQQARTKTLACRVQGAAWDAKEVDDNGSTCFPVQHACLTPPRCVSCIVVRNRRGKEGQSTGLEDWLANLRSTGLILDCVWGQIPKIPIMLLQQALLGLCRIIAIPSSRSQPFFTPMDQEIVSNEVRSGAPLNALNAGFIVSSNADVGKNSLFVQLANPVGLSSSRRNPLQGNQNNLLGIETVRGNTQAEIRHFMKLIKNPFSGIYILEQWGSSANQSQVFFVFGLIMDNHFQIKLICFTRTLENF